MKAHRHFVRTQIRTHFSQKEKEPYPFLHIALASMLQIPAETLTELPVLSMTGRHRLRVENYTSVLTYETGKIVLLCPKASLVILGEHLKIARLDRDEILIEGYIENIAYR
ncbi:MAG: YabP/YqfC family sporulation protein [Coprococcus sp.]